MHGYSHPQAPSLQIPWLGKLCVGLHGFPSHLAILGGSWPMVSVKADI